MYSGYIHTMIKSVFFRSIVLIIILVVVNAANSYAQWEIWPKHQIIFSPVRLVNLFSPGFEVSYELIHTQWSTQFSAVYLYDFFKVVPCGSDLSGYRLVVEEKYFDKTFVNKNRRAYFAFELAYNYISMNLESEFVPHEYLKENWYIQQENRYSDNCDIKRYSIAGNAKCGLQVIVSHLTLDMSPGIGLAHQNVKHFNKRHPGDQLTSHFEDIITPLFYDEGRFFIINFPFSFKIGVSF